MNQNIAQEGFAFHPERINKKGRPPKIFKVLKRSGYSKNDIRTAFHEIGWTDVSQLQKLFEDPKAPAIVKVIANAYKKAIQKGDYRYVRKIIEQVLGKPKESVEQKRTVETFNVVFNE